MREKKIVDSNVSSFNVIIRFDEYNYYDIWSEEDEQSVTELLFTQIITIWYEGSNFVIKNIQEQYNDKKFEEKVDAYLKLLRLYIQAM